MSQYCEKKLISTLRLLQPPLIRYWKFFQPPPPTIPTPPSIRQQRVRDFATTHEKQIFIITYESDNQGNFPRLQMPPNIGIVHRMFPSFNPFSIC